MTLYHSKPAVTTKGVTTEAQRPPDQKAEDKRWGTGRSRHSPITEKKPPSPTAGLLAEFPADCTWLQEMAQAGGHSGRMALHPDS